MPHSPLSDGLHKGWGCPVVADGVPQGAMPERLAAAGRAVVDAREHLHLSVELRNTLIVEAVDAGMSHHDVAAAVGLTRPGVIAVLIGSQPDAQLF